MALTLRLTQTEKEILQDIQFHVHTSTLSGTVKYMLSHWRLYERRISELETTLQECRNDRDKARSDLNRVKEAWKILQTIAEDGDESAT